MFHFFRYSYGGYAPVKYVVNPVRYLEFFLCGGCLLLAIIMVITLTYMSVWVKVIITTVAAAFFTITLIDLISNSYKNPIYWNTWTMFAMTGALGFFVCVGLLLATYTGLTIILIISEIINAVTAIIFLLDALLVLCALRKLYPEKKHPSCLCIEKRRKRSKTVVCPVHGLCECEEEKPIEKQPERHLSCTCLEVATNPPNSTTRYCPIHGQCECEEEEEEDVETTTVEKQIKTKTLYTNRNETVQELESDHLVERMETPGKRRSTTTYGGTFPVAKNAAPLPCPANLNPQPLRPCINKKKSNVLKLSTSQTIVPTATERIMYQGPDRKPFLTDGTPLSKTQLDNGNVGYKNPEGILYNKDGIPIILENEPEQVIKETYKQNIISQKLQQKEGDWYTHEGKKVPVVHKTHEGKLKGKKFREIETAVGKTLYESPEGYLYDQDGTPIGYNAVTAAETTRSYQKKIDQQLVRPTNYELCDCEESTSNQTLHELQPSCRRVSITLPPADSQSSDSGKSFIKGTSIDKVHKAPKSGTPMNLQHMTGAKIETFRTREIVRTLESELSSDYLYETISQESMKIIDISEPSSHHMNKSMTDGQKCLCGPSVSDDTAAKPHILYERYSPEDTPVHYVTNKNIPPTTICVRTNSPERFKPEAKSSRTVAISTRLVPKCSNKNQKSMSAPSSPTSKELHHRPVRSADNSEPPCASYQQQQQQLPQEFYHQYHQKPCPCGNIHYQTVSTVRGSVCSCSFHSQSREKADPRLQNQFVKESRERKVSPTPQRSSGAESSGYGSPHVKREECRLSGMKRDESVPPSSPRTQDVMERTPLQTISECECETDAPMSVSDRGSIQIYAQCSNEHERAEASPSERAYRIREDPQRATESDSAQTSETRMIRASDVQKMNTNRRTNEFK